jgi:hypothetical protein
MSDQETRYTVIETKSVVHHQTLGEWVVKTVSDCGITAFDKPETSYDQHVTILDGVTGSVSTGVASDSKTATERAIESLVKKSS